MIPDFDMSLYIRNNFSKQNEKMKKNKLTIENILEEDDIIQDLKYREDSQFLYLLSNKFICKLIDYAIKIPPAEVQRLGHKYPLKATEILIADNPEIQSRIMNENKYKKFEFYKDPKELKEKDDYDKTITVYDNIEHLLEFLKEPKEIVSNYVLVDNFSKILNHLITSQSSSKIVKYILDYPFKNKFDLLDAFVQNLNKKSMGSIIIKLLLFSEESTKFNFKDKKLILLKKMLQELEKTDEEDKFECICDVFCFLLKKASFFSLLTRVTEIIELLFSLLEKFNQNPKKLIRIIQILIKVNENVLKNFSTLCTKNLIQDKENFNINFSDSMDEKQNSYEQNFISEFSYFMDENKKFYEEIYNYEFSVPAEKKPTTYEEIYETSNRIVLSLLNSLKKNEFKFLEDLGEYSQDNEEFKTTFPRKKKKIGMKKLVQIKFLKTILDIFVNAYNANHNKRDIIELIDIMKNKNIFYYCHKLFFNFQNSKNYLKFYNQIFDIVLNVSSPKKLVEYFFKYKDEKEANIVKYLIKNFYNKINSYLYDCKASFGSNITFEVILLHKIYKSENEDVKKLFYDDKCLKAFFIQINNNIFNQNLLLEDNSESIIKDEDEENSFPNLSKHNFMNIVDDNSSIDNLYKKRGDYKTKLYGKLKREKNGIERREKEIIGEEEESEKEEIEYEENEEVVKKAEVVKNKVEEKSNNGNENGKKEDEENEEKNESLDEERESNSLLNKNEDKNEKKLKKEIEKIKIIYFYSILENEYNKKIIGDLKNKINAKEEIIKKNEEKSKKKKVDYEQNIKSLIEKNQNLKNKYNELHEKFCNLYFDNKIKIIQYEKIINEYKSGTGNIKLKNEQEKELVVKKIKEDSSEKYEKKMKLNIQQFSFYLL